MGDRRVNFHRLVGFAALLFGRLVLHRPHIVQPVGQLDEDNADILVHRQKHLADILRLLLLFGREGHVGQLGDAADHNRDVRAEGFFQFVERHRRILNDVVQKRRADTVGIHSHSDQDDRTGNRRGNIRITRPADLTSVCLVRHFIGAFNLFYIIILIARFQSGDQVVMVFDFSLNHGCSPSDIYLSVLSV